jgi:hypothetical protein
MTTAFLAVWLFGQQLMTMARSESFKSGRSRIWPLVMIGIVSAFVNLAPSAALHQSDFDFERIYRRFERTAPAESAESPSETPQSKPIVE